MIDDIPQRVDSLLHRIVDLMMHRPEEISHLAGLCKIRRAFKTDSETMQPRPPGRTLPVILDTARSIGGSDRAYYRRIQTAAEQNSVRDIRHQLPLDSFRQSLPDQRRIRRSILDRIIISPVTAIPFSDHAFAAPEHASRRERLEFGAAALKGLHLACDHQQAVSGMTDVERNHAYRIPGDKILVFFLIIQNKRKNTAEIFQESGALFLIQRQNDFTVRACAEIIISAQFIPQRLMVIDLSIDSQNLASVGRIERLAAGYRIDYGQPLMGQYGRAAAVDTAPVRAPVSKLKAHL